MNIEKELDQYDLRLRESDNPERLPIDFSIEDDDDNICWVWGKDIDDVEVECNHPYQCIDWDDDDTCGECELCGAQCEWHWVAGEGNYKDREPHAWHMPNEASGLISKYLKSLRGN